MKPSPRPRWARWIRSASAHRTFPVYATGIVIVDFFFPVLPSTALVVGGSMLAPKKWFAIALGCSIGGALGCLMIATIFQEFGWKVIEALFGDLQSAPQWKTIEWAIQSYGPLALLLFSALPMPLRVPTLLAALAGLPALLIALIVLTGRIMGYGLLAHIAARSPEKVLRLPLIRRSKLLHALLKEDIEDI